MNKKTHSITENKSVKKPRRAGLEKGRGRMRSKGRQINASAHNDVRRLLGGRKRRSDLLLEHLHLVQDYCGFGRRNAALSIRGIRGCHILCPL